MDSREQLKPELESCYGQDAPGRVAATFSEVLAGKHPGRTSPGQRVLIIDDVLATGGTAKAAASLVKQLGGQLHALAFLIELDFLKGREQLAGERVASVLHY